MRKKRRSAYLLESLEARLLFSADLAPLPVDGGTSGADFESDLEISLQPDSAGVQEAGENTQERQEVIFVDTGVDDYQQLIDDIESQLEKGRQFDIVNLESDSDGIDQISAYLKQHEGIDAVHVVSHGSEDAVKLGNVWLTPDKLDAYGDAIEGWQQALSSDADLLFYGCNLAAGDVGQDLVNSLTLLTGADVAASDDVTGSANLGGDWDLEYRMGQIDTAVAFSLEAQKNWNGVLTTFTVNTTADTVDANPGDGIAEDAAGNTSLRAAIMEANALAGADSITLSAGTYSISIAGTGDDVTLTGDLDITSDLTITGMGAGVTVIDGDGLDRVFHINWAGNATISNLTIQNGGNVTHGGGIRVSGGGGGGRLNLENVIVRNNTASGNGGGIFVDGVVTLTNVEISGNTTSGTGGGLSNDEQATLTGVTISGNSAADGGGIYNSNQGSLLELTNVTVSGNTATANGGGIYTAELVKLTNVTLTSNLGGGGIYATGGQGDVQLKNSILANNTGGNSNLPLTSLGYNIEDGNSAFTPIIGDQPNTDPSLAPLQNNGGFTQTHALLAGSPAIDPVGLSGAPLHDQRGFARDVTPDIGAFEYNVSNTAPTLTVAGAATVKEGEVYTLNLSASDPDDDIITSWTINWGDGAIETIPGNPSSVTHIYTQAGFTYNIIVSATDVTGTYIHNDLFAGHYINDAGVYRIQGAWGAPPVEFATEGTLDKTIQPIIGPDGNLYLSGESSRNVLRYNTGTGAFIDVFANIPGEAGGIAFGPDGNLYVVDYTNGEILRFNGSDGSAMGAFVTGIGGKPYSLTFGPDGNLYVALYDNAEVLKYDGLSGTALGTFISAGAGGLGTPEQIVFGPDGNLYVADVANNSVLRFNGADGTPMGDFIADSEPHLDKPNGLAFGPDGNLYVSDSQDGVILRFDGSTGAFIDEYADGLDKPSLLAFAPDLQVHVVANAPPTFSSFIGPVTSGNEDSEITVTFGDLAVQGNENDADGTVDAFVVKSVTSGTLRIGATAGSATAWAAGTNDTIDASNNAYWTPDLDATGIQNAFEVVAKDDCGLESTPNVTAEIDVTAQNDAPTANNLTSTSAYNEGDAAVAITDIVVSDVDTAETITATLTLTDTTTGSLSANGGATYDGGTGVWTITDTVANVNLALANLVFNPLTNNDVDTTISVSIDDGDEDASGPLTGTIALDVTPANDAPTASDLTSTSTYNEGDATVDITDIVVTDVDSGETITATLTLNDTTTGSLSANDGATYDGLTGVWTITDTVANVNFALANLVFTPLVNNDVDTTITTHIEDAAGAGPADGTITLDVTPANDAPTATNLTSTSTYNEGDATVAITDIVVSDVDTAETITATLTLNDTATGSLSANNGATYDGGTGEWTITDTVANVNLALANLVFNPNTNNDVDTTITTHIEDAAGAGPVNGTITLDVTPANDAPTATNLTSTSSYNEGDATVDITDIVVTDVDSGETITATLTLNDTSTGSLSANNGATYDGLTGVWTITDTVANVNLALANLVFTPLVDNDVDTTITTHIEDAAGAGPADGTITLDVTPVNDVPVATGNTVIASEDVPLVIGPGDFNFTDVEGDSLASVTISGLNLNSGTLTHSAGAVTVTNGMTITAAELADLTFTSALNDSTDCSFTYTVNDAGTGVTSAVMNITVNAVNDVPVATGNTVIASEDVPLVIGPGDFSFTDTEGDSLVSVTITGLNLNGGTLTHSAGAVTVTNGMTITAAQLADLTFTSALNNSTDCSFTYTVNDAGTGVTSAVMNITVNAVNDAGTVTIDNTTPAQGDTLTANVIDPDGISGAITYQWLSDGAVIGGATGKTYTTTQGDVGAVMTVTAIYIDDQSTAESLTSAPTAPVTNVNDAPIAGNDNLNAIEDQSMTFTSVSDLLGNDSDIDGDTLTLSGFSQPANGSLVDNGDGTVTYTSAGNFSGVDSFTYAISDSKGGTATGAAIILITPVGDTPQVTNVSTNAEVQSGLINIDRNANDGAEVTHFKISGITNGTLYLADGVTRIDNGNFITVGQGQAGLRFTPATNSTTDGSFNVESSEDGVSVASQSGIATSTISILTTAPQPSEPVPSLPTSGPEEVVSEETDIEETEELEDVAEETDVQAAADDMASVEAPQNAKAPGIKKASLVPGLAVLKRAELDSNHDRTPGRSTLFSPQTLKKLVESENLGELKTALRKLDITTLPPDVYALVRGSLDAVQEEMGNEILIGKTVVGSAIATSVGLSAGYVVWMLKGGSLLASVLSSLPAWQLADPLAILVGTKEDEDEDDDTLETIIKDGSRRNEDKERKASELDKHKKESTKR